MSKPVSIYLVDDHAVVRNGLKALIERLGNYTITGQFDNGKELMDSLPFEPMPDIIIMDMVMPVMDGKETVAALKERDINIPVLMLTLESDERVIIELFRLGIRGYLPKSCTADVLKKAIDDVTDSGYYHNEILIKALSAPDKKGDSSIINLLTQREKEFVQLVCDEHEYTYDQIAGLMGVSRRTVDGYREEIFHKFDIKSKTGLVLLAIKHGIVNINAKKV